MAELLRLPGEAGQRSPMTITALRLKARGMYVKISPNSKELISMQEVDFIKGGGLIPVIVQDYRSREVLMLGYMSQEAWQKTQMTGKAHYYSRSRRKLWLKGEESGHFQEVKEAFIDCDNDTLLLRVKQHGGGACHLGFQSCFFRKKAKKGWRVAAKRVFKPEEVYRK